LRFDPVVALRLHHRLAATEQSEGDNNPESKEVREEPTVRR
jgi:hypothetical protein